MRTAAAPAAEHPGSEHWMSIRTNEELDPNEGPGFGCFIWQALLFAGILLLIPVALFSLNWPVWVLVVLLCLDMFLLFFISMTSVFLLRVFFADRRRGRGRTVGVARPPIIVDTPADAAETAETDPDQGAPE